ncbi:MAG: hypothetical protein IPG71_05455 [bacterium]|nr:hypothetical protein [bacterium]
MDEVTFEERQDFFLRGVLAFASGAAFFVIPLFTTMPLPLILLMFVLGVGMTYLMASFMQMHTRVTTTELTFGPKIWTKRFPLTATEVVGPVDIPLAAGIGIHGLRGKVYFNMRLGKGLAVRHNNRVYVIGSQRIPEFQMALEAALRGSRA